MQQPYVAKPTPVLAEQFVEGATPAAVGVCFCTLGSPWAPTGGTPHAHVGYTVVEVHATDWVITASDTVAAMNVITDDTFRATYEPPRPLQEIEGVWVCSVNTTIQNPTNGQIRLNAATVEATTTLALHKLTDANVDYSAALETAVVDDVIYIQSAKEAKNWARVTLTGDCARQQNEWYQVPVVWTEGSGQTFIEGNNKLLINLELSHRVDRTQVIP